jgi:hypothetical protein
VLFSRAYGTDGFFWGAGSVAICLLLFWGFVRQLQHGPAFGPPPRPRLPPRPEPLRERFRWAFGWSYAFAILYSGYVLVLSVVRGSTSFPAYGLSTWGIIATYWLGATLAGLILGFCKPLTQYRLGAFLVGTLVGSAIYGTAMLALPQARSGPWWLALIPGVIVGGGLGLVEHDES